MGQLKQQQHTQPQKIPPKNQLKKQHHPQAKQRLNSNVQSHTPKIQSPQSRRQAPSASQHPTNKILPSGVQKSTRMVRSPNVQKATINQQQPGKQDHQMMNILGSQRSQQKQKQQQNKMWKNDGDPSSVKKQ